MKNGIMMLLGGLVIFVVGLILAGIVISTAATTGAVASVGSFTGVRAMNDLAPLLFYVGLIVLGLGLMIGGGLTAYRNK